MKISNEYPVMIFKNTYENKDYYSLGLSKKNQDGTYANGYIQCQFRKGVAIENQTNIYIKDAWLSFYLKDNKTMPYVFINECELVADVIKNTDKSVKSVKQDETVLTDADLPF